ncbi:hypothetical protein [Streptomyces sp. NPDC051310]|uniref:hypothetical protein n=1 Tax=Streptomyces sp. NPDC051310 TaxID=3365649 RepID=UPI003788AEBA
MIRRNPTSRIKVGQNDSAVLQPLLPEQVERSVAAALTPAARLVLALAAVHAARIAHIVALVLEDVDLGNRRLTIAGRARLLDDLTLELTQGLPTPSRGGLRARREDRYALRGLRTSPAGAGRRGSRSSAEIRGKGAMSRS